MEYTERDMKELLSLPDAAKKVISSAIDILTRNGTIGLSLDDGLFIDFFYGLLHTENREMFINSFVEFTEREYKIPSWLREAMDTKVDRPETAICAYMAEKEVLDENS